MNIINSAGLSFHFLENGKLKFIDADPIRISLKAATFYSKSGANIYLRKRKEMFEFKALLGPESNSRFKVEENKFIAEGNWSGINYVCVLQLSEKMMCWQWNIVIKNNSGGSVDLDLIYVQDAGLKTITSELINEYYVSQYLERLILEDNNYGSVICCRQNMKESLGNPWLMLACKTRAISASVDGMQFYGKTFRETGIPEGLITDFLDGEYAGESSVLALQEKPFSLSSGDSHKSEFAGIYFPDHPEATSEYDLNLLSGLIFESCDDILYQTNDELIVPDENLFNTSLFLPADELTDEDINSFFGKERRNCEEEDGQLLSFFCGQNNHVMLLAKETIVDRPHGHIMQTNAGFAPDENIVSTTSFAYGVFNSHLSQGNTNFNVLLSVCSSQFNLDIETGQRIFIGIGDTKYLLGVPSAFEMGLNHCRWIYKYGVYCFQVRCWASKKEPQINMDFKVISGDKVSLLITHHFDDTNHWHVYPGVSDGEFVAKPKQDSMIANKFPKAQFRIIVNSPKADYKVGGDEILSKSKVTRGANLFVLDIEETSEFYMSFIGEVCYPVKLEKNEDADTKWLSDSRDAQDVWSNLCLNLTLNGGQQDIAAIKEILPWYGLNALTHYLTPFGLEQFSGAAWGTRDICQGPFDLLLCMEKYDEARQLLRIIFSNQNQDGGWPQWWMFDSYSDIRADSAHGDVIYWCIIALSNYIKVTGDLEFLNEVLPYYNDKIRGGVEKTTISEHIARLIKMIVDSYIPGTAFVPFGGGDWNDSLQPVSRELAQRMISSWTVEMNYQAFKQYLVVCEQAGNRDEAKKLKEICEKIKISFDKHLIKDGVVAGYGLVEKDQSISLLLNPDDKKTGISYSILPMNRGIISGIFSKEQALLHQDLIEQHLKGPDGARLMDRPLRYKGGIQSIFQRAETSTFFGREIGLMYVHEHIRYAESLAITGKADAFLQALRQAIPVAYREIVQCGDVRQSNCYYSSSDVIFKTRYEADRLYNEIIKGKTTLKGGWRVYSSGPGIFIGIIVSRFLGLRTEYGKFIIDPVMPDSLDGFSARIDIKGHSVKFIYSIKWNNFSPKSISINGKAVKYRFEDNTYRKGGAAIPADQFLALLSRGENIVEVKL